MAVPKQKRSSQPNPPIARVQSDQSDQDLQDHTSTEDVTSEINTPKYERYNSSLTEASEKCRKNMNFNFFDLMDKESRDSPCILGIDEAGRGPVLGPMVYACAVAPVSRLDQLNTVGFADSKQLTESKRSCLLNDMLSKFEWITAGVHVISPFFISEKMLDRCKTNLNTISHDAAIGLIHAALDAGINVTEAYVDTVGKPEFYQAKLQALFPKLRICVESKADSTYAIVSAASIFAKVTRDRLLRLWPQEERGIIIDDDSLGSGYPGDPSTKSYLESCIDPVFGFPSLVRASWSTATTLLDKHGVKITWEDDESAEKVAEAKRLARKRDLAKGTCQLSSFFSPTAKSNESKRACTRQTYFARTGMVHVDTLI